MTCIFSAPSNIGNIVNIQAEVTYAGRTSMEIEAIVHSEEPKTGKRHKTSIAYLTFVAVDDHGKPLQVPPIFPESEDEKLRYEAAKLRKQKRLEAKALWNNRCKNS